jgi:NAD(P)H-flavin reductase
MTEGLRTGTDSGDSDISSCCWRVAIDAIGTILSQDPCVSIDVGPELASFDAVVSRTADLTKDVRQIDFELIAPAELSFAAGQFVSFEAQAPAWPYPVIRSYSIVSDPHDRNHLAILLNLVPGGRMSPHLFALRPGDRTTFRGPLGTFCLRPGNRDLLFVATGTGIAPVRSMLSTLARQQSARRITLFWGLRTQQDIYFQRELVELRDRLPRFDYVTTLSRAGEGWTGSRGTVTPLVDSRIETVSNLDAYVCGNQSMIKDVTAALNRKGLCPVYREQYYRDDASAA